MSELEELWKAAIADLPRDASMWLTKAQPVGLLNENTLIIGVPNDFTRQSVETKARSSLERALSESFGKPISIAVTVDPELADKAINLQIDNIDIEEDEEDDFDLFTTMDNQISNDNIAAARLNPRYTFDKFVIGLSNRFTHAAALAVAESPGKSYNPLLIWGGSGLGKTHLLHAIGHYVLSVDPNAKVRYVNTEEFTNDVINAIRGGPSGVDMRPALRARYREVDVLLVDDIQFIEGREATQEEFFHTFEALHNANKQIVITSDRNPAELKTLNERLQSRFKMGLQTDVQPPDLETRIAILRKKAQAERLTAPADVLEFIARRGQTNIRELEGALIRATAFANLNGQPVDLQTAQIALKDLMPESDDPEISAMLILNLTAQFYQFTVDDLLSPQRTRDLVLARQIAMYLCRELTDLSLPKIGQIMGGRDHTTVLHAERKIRETMGEKRQVFDQISELTNQIKKQARQL